MSGNSTHTEADSREDNLPLSQQSNVSNFIEEEGSEDSRPSDGESRRKRRRNTELDDGVSDDEGGTVPHSSGVPQMSLEELQHLAELATQPSDVQLCKPSKGKIPAKPKNMTVKQSGAFDSSFVEFEELSCQKKPTGKKKADTHKACRDHVAHLESLATELLDGASRVHSSREKQWSNYADDCENEIVRLSDFNSNQYTRAKEISKERDVLQKKFSKLEGQSKSTIQSQKYEITGLKAKLASELKMVGKLEQQVKKLKAELEEEKSLETPRDLNNTKSSAGVGTNDLDDYERKRMIDLRYYEEKTRVDVLKKEEAENKKLKAKHSRMQQVQSSMSWMSSSGGLSGSGTGMFSAPGMTNMMVRFEIHLYLLIMCYLVFQLRFSSRPHSHSTRISSHLTSNMVSLSSMLTLSNLFTVSKEVININLREYIIT